MARGLIGRTGEKGFYYELNQLTRHAAVLGTTGSGKTVMSKVLLEEALQRRIPVIAIDPKGDLGGLGITSKNYDFRPFLNKQAAERTANMYSRLMDADVTAINKLSATTTKIYTPKSTVGIPISLIPDLSAPANFAKLTIEDPNLVADFVEPISEAIVEMAGIGGVKKEKAQALISSILIHNWETGRNLELIGLIEQIKRPGFENIGGLQVEEFLKEKERAAIAASVNLILSSPAKNAWKHGEKIDIHKMFTPSNLSIFDLRYGSNVQEKQLITEQVLQEIYKFLVRKGGSPTLKYVLYIDELAGLLPPPPANPPSKKLLELLVRQARAFGLGIIVATQSPGDIDYRIFGNMGTRFIGKLRTEREVEKVAAAMSLAPGKLKQDLSGLRTGEFVFNDAVKNQNRIIQGRWVYTYHAGPLNERQISWVNNPKSKPKAEGNILVKKATLKKSKGTRKSARKLLAELDRESKSKKRPVAKVERAKRISKQGIWSLSPLVKQVKRYADKSQMKIASPDAKKHTPHLRIVVESKHGMQGPYVFDLTSRAIPLGDYLKNHTWSTFIPEKVNVIKHKISIERVFKYSIREAMDGFKAVHYHSTLANIESQDKEEVEKKNHELLTKKNASHVRQLDTREYKAVEKLRHRIASNNKRISRYAARIRGHKGKKIVARVFKGKKIRTPPEIKVYKHRIRLLKGENKRILHKIKSIHKEYQDKRQKLRDKIFQKSLHSIREKRFRPKRKDLVVHATILLVPARRAEI